jgi:hypothetical protein
MPKFSPGETVWVSSTHLPGTQPFALMEREVLAVEERSIVDDGRGGTAKASTRTTVSKAPIFGTGAVALSRPKVRRVGGR